MFAVGADVKEVINGLEMSYKYSNVDENNTLVPQWIVIRALALLKAQQPRVMTMEEMPERHEIPCWIEWRDGDFYAAILYVNDLKVDYMKFYTSCAFMKSEYGITVRCWTSRPTYAQRMATPWN